MTTDVPSLTEALEQERKRLAAKPKKEKTEEQRERERARSKWHDNIWSCWFEAHLLIDEELVWLSQITGASKAKGTRASTNPWTGNTRKVTQPTSGEDALKLAKLLDELRMRADRERQQRQQQRRRKVRDTLARLGLEIPLYYQIDGEAP